MIELTADSWFNIKGRGQVACVVWPEGVSREDVLGVDILIDGKPFEVRGMEMFRPLYTGAPFEEDEMTGRSVGLLVKPK